MIASTEDSYTAYLQTLCVEDGIDEHIVRDTLLRMGFTESKAASILGDTCALHSSSTDRTTSRSRTSSSSLFRLAPPVRPTSSHQHQQQHPEPEPEEATAAAATAVLHHSASSLFDSHSALSRDRQEQYLSHLSTLRDVLKDWHASDDCVELNDDKGRFRAAACAASLEASQMSSGAGMSDSDDAEPVLLLPVTAYSPRQQPWKYSPRTASFFPRGGEGSQQLRGHPINREPVGAAPRHRVADVGQRTARAEAAPHSAVMRATATARGANGPWVPSSLPRRERCDRVRLAQYYREGWSSQEQRASRARDRAISTTRARLLQ